MDREQYLQVARSAGICALCGQSLAGKERHPSIIEDLPAKQEKTREEKSRKDKEEEHKPSRKDFCPQCWQNLGDRNYFSFWLAKRAKPAPNRRLAKSERNEALWRLFSALTAQPTEETLSQCFLLAHLLMKYGILRWKANIADGEGARWIVFEHASTGEECRVRDLALTDDGLVQALQDIESAMTRNVNPEIAEDVRL